MTKQFGWAGKILFVDLSNRKTEYVNTLDYTGRFIGGRGITGKIYWDRVSSNTDALSPENLFMLMTGPLAGTPAYAASRTVVSGKSALLYPDQCGIGSIGGDFGNRIKAAGLDGIVVSGRAEKPSLLYVDNTSVDIVDAEGLWGQDCSCTLKYIRSRYGNTAEVLCIGQAGENRVRFSLLMGNNGSCGSHGFGAVMGSKNLKAVVVRGGFKPQTAFPDRLKEINREIRRMIKGRLLMDPMIGFIELEKRAPCKGCPAGCPRGVFRHDSGVVEHRKNCASSYFYYDWDKLYHGGESIGNSFHATSLANRLGLCTQELIKILKWLDVCVKKGLISEAQAGIPLKDIGSRAFIETFLTKITHREGFCDILAEGTIRAAMQLGQDHEACLDGIVEGSGFSADLYHPRYFITNALFHAIDKTNCMQQLHEICYPLFKWVLWYATDGQMSQVDTAALRKIADRFWGGEQAGDFSTYEGKGISAFVIQNRVYAKETLVGCDFFYPVITPEGKEDHVGDPTIENRLLSAVTGTDFDEKALYLVGERVFNLQRAINCRDGYRGRKDDDLPDFNFTAPLLEDKIYFGMFNPEFLLPGPGGELISRKGAVLDREKFNKMLDDYYRARGWDAGTGFQTEEKLTDLDIRETIPELRQLGCVA